MNRCSWPKTNTDPCNKPAVAIYVLAGERYFRCKAHDTAKVRATADEMGAQRLPVAA